MGTGKSIVLTVFGHDKTIDKISVSLFDKIETSNAGYFDESSATNYCEAINSLELKGESWVHARIVSENTRYAADEFVPLRFDVLLKIDDRAVQRILRELDSQIIAVALKGSDQAMQEKVFKNMSSRAAGIVKEDMEYMGSIPPSGVSWAQKHFTDLIRKLEHFGEIVIKYDGEPIV